jgi:HAD superfamily hydrolase (TIGR01509 family)
LSELRAVMVDLDGTLARTSDSNWLAYSLALKEAGLELSPQDVQARAQARNWRAFLPELLAETGISAADVVHRKKEIYRSMLDTVEINWALVSMLRACRTQMKTALVTTASAESVFTLLAIHNLRGHFDTIVTGGDVTHHKPHPEAYTLAAARLGVDPSQCLVYEDADEGVASATTFGAHVIRIVF